MSELSGLDTSALLNKLRDIQEPLAPQGTPLWLIAMTIALAAILVYLVWLQNSRKKYAFRLEALKRIDAISQRCFHGTPSPTSPLFDLATLLRQLMRHRQGDKINTLVGTEWLNALDTEFSSQWFSKDRGQIFGRSLYQKRHFDNAELTQLCTELKAQIQNLKPSTRPAS